MAQNKITKLSPKQAAAIDASALKAKGDQTLTGTGGTKSPMELVRYVLPIATRNTDQTLIVPKGSWNAPSDGYWFAKKSLKEWGISVTGRYYVILARGDMEKRGKGTIAPYAAAELAQEQAELASLIDAGEVDDVIVVPLGQDGGPVVG